MELTDRYKIKNVLDWAYGGVNGTIPGNGGPECAEFLTTNRKIIESIIGCILAIIYVSWGYHNITYPTTFPFVRYVSIYVFIGYSCVCII